MQKIDGCRTDRKNCVVCFKKTGKYIGFSYTNGIEIDIPVCDKCKPKFGWCLNTSMKIHLQGIQESVRHSVIITSDEKKIMELQDELAKMGGK